MIENNSGMIAFHSDDEALNRGFAWAKGQAQEYVHDGSDAVGLWYEAALPGREAFCMRDVSHQSLGAAILGLHAHTRNMMQRFAENISQTRDYCTYWEITKENVPAPVDYVNDQDFWYNLPANFDVIEACYRQYLWTGDRTYLEDPVMQNFYALSVTEYVKAWDKDGDGIPEYEASYGRRGLASYNEAGEFPRIGADLIAIMIAGYQAYAEMAKLNGNDKLHQVYSAKSVLLQQQFEEQWWNEADSSFFAAVGHDKAFIPTSAEEGQFLPLYYEAIHDHAKRNGALSEVLK
ncbi:MAG: glycoside hydrolase family 116 protein, partial [Gorillibacterium sp.]|nr:glycoside hydrolase family 116 protein [Gorillibacterium sp.]